MDREFFILGIISIVMLTWVLNNWIRARHGFSITDDWGRTVEPRNAREATLVAEENERLRGQVTKLEDRIAVLERIATDQPNRLSAEIERLREQPLN